MMIWRILGIAPTSDIERIKEAYASLAKKYNPEEYPEKFSEIHMAYKEACSFARTMHKLYGTKHDDDDKEYQPDYDEDDSGFDFSSVGNAHPETENTNDNADTPEDFDFSPVEGKSAGEKPVRENTDDEKPVGGKEEKEEENDIPLDRVTAAIVLTSMHCLLRDREKRGNAACWAALLSSAPFLDVCDDTSFRSLAADLFSAEVLPSETAELIASAFGGGSKLLYVSSYPEKECIVKISEDKNDKDILTDIREAGNSAARFFRSIFR